MSMHGNKKTYGLARIAASIGNSYYPETLGDMFIINAPKLFTGIFSIVLSFLDEKTRKKIQIIGSNYLPTLQDYVDIENIPTFLGGNCECQGGCMQSNKGPWQDYELDGRRIRRKPKEPAIFDKFSDDDDDETEERKAGEVGSSAATVIKTQKSKIDELTEEIGNLKMQLQDSKNETKK